MQAREALAARMKLFAETKEDWLIRTGGFHATQMLLEAPNTGFQASAEVLACGPVNICSHFNWANNSEFLRRNNVSFWSSIMEIEKYLLNIFLNNI